MLQLDNQGRTVQRFTFKWKYIMSNVSIEPGAEIYKGSFSLRFAPKPEDKYVPRNYDEECICTGMHLLSEGKTEEGLGYLLIAWDDEDLWAGELLSWGR